MKFVVQYICLSVIPFSWKFVQVMACLLCGLTHSVEAHRYVTKCKYNCELMDLVFLSLYDLLFIILKTKKEKKNEK